MAEPIESRADPARRQLIRSVFEPSSLQDVTEAVAVAVADGESQIYLERNRGQYRWSLCCQGGPYPLLRISARFLKADYHGAFIGFCTTPDGWCILVDDRAGRVEPDAWTVLPGSDLAGCWDLAAVIKAVLDASPNMWPGSRAR
jgi:hypothetical protein